jgi:predicted HTH domain antitoxin
MMTTVEIQVPEAVLISLKEMPESIVQELRMLAAVKLFELGKLSSGRAAELAGLSRVAFLMALGRYCVSPLQLADDELAQDIDHA